MVTKAIKTLVDDYVRSDYSRNGWGESSDDYINDPERCERCDRAAEDGADGSTHREVIEDWRKGLRRYLESLRRNRNSEYPYRIESAMLEDFNETEECHTKAGSIDQEIG